MILICGINNSLKNVIIIKLLQNGKKIKILTKENYVLNKDKNFIFYFNKINNKNININNIKYIKLKYIQQYNNQLNNIFKDIKEIYYIENIYKNNKKEKNNLFNLINISLINGIKKFCYIKNISDLFFNKKENIKEENLLCLYNKRGNNYIKYIPEIEIWRGIKEGLNTVIVNPSKIISRDLIKNCIQNKFFLQKFIKTKFFSRGYVDVRDVAECSIKLMNKNFFGNRYIINSENLINKEFFKILNFNNILNKENNDFLKKNEILLSKCKYYSTFSSEKFKKIINYKFIKIKESILFHKKI
ncbi:hypothetical protein [Candidatus Shikimatogenerans silvanidophilus]|uniref:hypothetical protein n=1 Tax=Candidatus Shikimatogenerans silvanidophilus TaxID=2782547 RepID=UPI001BAD64AF|nr:hypothetical protein [Candidatus Shikimatogenerans silvanidophilus]